MCKTTAKCQGILENLEKCGREMNVSEMTYIKKASGNYCYVCPECATTIGSYYTENGKRLGKAMKHDITTSIELETSKTNSESRLLYDYGFLPTHDGSISGIEWKSPIWTSLLGKKEFFLTVEKICHFDSECGTHLNVGTFNSTTMDYIRRFYHTLFIPLCEELKKDEALTTRFFGRYFVYYARAIDEQTFPQQHEIFVNTQHDTHLEFRLCKFQTAEQYTELMKWGKAVVETIKANFIDHFNDDNIDTSLNTPTAIKVYRKHKAEITAKKIVKLFHKFADNNDIRWTR